MSAEPGPDLRLHLFWLTIGYVLVVLVVYLSLTSSPVELEMDFPYQDKFFHALAYFTLMTWFSQIYHDGFKRNIIALIFISMGILLEYLQSFDPNRYYEIADMVANATGVLLGLVVTASRAKNILLAVEKYLANLD
jgi:VanZ family protein